MIVVEVLGRRGEVVRQLRLDRLPATIGRGWSNDVVLGDPTVDAAHARIAAAEDGTLALEDLGSVNGMRAGRDQERVPRVVLNGVTSVRLGRTMLRLARTDQAVPPAIPDLVPTGRLANLLASPGRMLLLHAAGVGLIILAAVLAAYDPKAGAGAAGRVVLAVASVSAWAGVWSLIGRVRTQQFLFPQHSTLTWLTVIAITIIGEIAVLLDFLWPSQGTFSALAGFTGACLAVALMTAQLGLVSAARRSYRVGLATAITIVMAWLGVLAGKAVRSDFDSGTVQISATLAPIPAKLVPSRSVEDFLRSTDDLKREIDGRR